jgi:small GTP-binding protein
MKCATVAVIGRPSSGKSTLVNTICEMKVSITAATPQTTRNAIRGIYTDQRGQLIFTDTPGYHLSEQKLNLKLQETAKASLEETDIVLYVIDPTRKGGEEELAIAHLLGAIKTPVVAVLNKSDIASGMEMLEAESFLTTNLPQAKRLHASAKEDNGVDEILIALFDLAKEGETALSGRRTDRPEPGIPDHRDHPGESHRHRHPGNPPRHLCGIGRPGKPGRDQHHLDPGVHRGGDGQPERHRHRRRRPEHP